MRIIANNFDITTMAFWCFRSTFRLQPWTLSEYFSREIHRNGDLQIEEAAFFATRSAESAARRSLLPTTWLTRSGLSASHPQVTHHVLHPGSNSQCQAARHVTRPRCCISQPSSRAAREERKRERRPWFCKLEGQAAYYSTCYGTPALSSTVDISYTFHSIKKSAR